MAMIMYLLLFYLFQVMPDDTVYLSATILMSVFNDQQLSILLLSEKIYSHVRY